MSAGTFPELGNIGQVQGLGVDALDAPFDLGRVDDNAFWEDPRHGGRTGKPETPPAAAALLG